jgi:hypothetical protein
MEGGEGGSTTTSLNDDGAPVVAAEGSCNWEEVGKGEAPIHLAKHGVRGGAPHDEAVVAASW